MIVVLVPIEQVVPMWPLASSLIQKAIDYYPSMDINDVLEELKADSMQLWVALEDDVMVAAFTTQLVNYPQYKECLLVHCGGERFQEWGPLLDVQVSEFAKAEGCSKLATQGRKGTEKLYAPWGFEFELVKLTKVI